MTPGTEDLGDAPTTETTDDQLDGDEVYCPKCGGTFSPHLDQCPDDRTRLIRWYARVDPLIGMTLDNRYRVTRLLGEGGMGLVYEGVQLSVDRPVAIKVIREELSQDRAIAKRFLREARLLTSLSHPNIVNVYDFGQTPRGALYLVMELLRGETLEALLEHCGPLTPLHTCELAIQLCDALVTAHACGVVHRDLKPGNLVIVDMPPMRDLVKVLDFGIAKSLATDEVTSTLTQAGAVLGTPLYMAPEIVSGAVADPRSDLYAVGCMIHEMLTGVAPFADAAVSVVMSRHLCEPPPRLPDDVPRSLRQLVDDLLAKSIELRPTSAGEVRTRLQDVLADLETPQLAEAKTLVRIDSPAGGSSGNVPMYELPTLVAEELRILPRSDTTTARVGVRSGPRSHVPAIAAVVIAVVIVAVAWCLAIRHEDPIAPPSQHAPAKG